MGAKKLAIPALATAGGAGAGAGGAYATGSYLSQSSVKQDASLETIDQSNISHSTSMGEGTVANPEKTTSVSTITNSVYKTRYSEYSSTQDVIAEKCSKDMFGISDFTQVSVPEETVPYKGCLYVDVQKFEDKVVLINIEMALKKDNKGLIFGTSIHNIQKTHELSSSNKNKSLLRQTHWSLRVGKGESGNEWKVKDGWRWSSPIFDSGGSARSINITLSGKAVPNDVSVLLSDSLCYMENIENCLLGASMQSVFNNQYTWEHEDAAGEEMFQFLKVSLSDSILYWTGQKLIFDEANAGGEFVDGSQGPSDYLGASPDRSVCEQHQNDDKAPGIGRIFYTHQWSAQNWKNITVTDANKPFVLTECAFDVDKGDDGKLKTTKFKWS